MTEYGPDAPATTDQDVRARLRNGDAVTTFRRLASPARTPALSTATALLRLGRVQNLDDLGAAGPLNAATTADAPEDADPELRKFEAVFGRDALRVDEFIGGLFPRLRRATIETLARGQGIQHDAASEEEPGKIVHEWRDPDDPIAREITANSGWGWPYYGSADSTPLFIRAAIRFIDAEPAAGLQRLPRRDGSRPTLTDCVADAVRWLCDHLDNDPDGLLPYRRINPKGIENQTWRDSWDSLSDANGSLPDFDRPVAALDVQVAAYDALVSAAEQAGRDDSRRAAELTRRAQRLREAVLSRFWTEQHTSGFFAAALGFTDASRRRPLRTRTSDMGHLLASRILHGDDVREYRDAVVGELFSPGMLCSAGVRSLHSGEVRYWPGGYHTGNSWLWQTMHIADGLDRHGFPRLADELRSRCERVHRLTGLLPEFARGDDNRGVLNNRVIDIRQAADRRINRVEQPPQEVQAWTVASLHAAYQRGRVPRRSAPDVATLEEHIVEQVASVAPARRCKT